MKCNSRSTCTSHTGCFAWRGRGRARWRSPRAGKLSRCTCRFWPKPSGLQGSCADHLEGVGLWGRRYDDGWRGAGVTPGQHSPVKQGVCEEDFTYWSIWDSTAEVQPLGFRTAEGDTWSCYISHGLPGWRGGECGVKKKVTVSQVNANKVASNTNHLLKHIS